MGNDKPYRFATKVIHAAIEPDPTTGAVMTPVYLTSTYAQAAPGNHKGYEYSRTANPTRTALERNLAALENGSHGLCFGSGMAAIDTAMKLLAPGDEVICTSDLYGGTYRLFTKVYERYGLKFHFVDMQDVSNVAAALNEKTKMVWVETPTNPLLNIIDIAAIAQLKSQQDFMLAVDNTFATPYLQLPLDLGADIIMHSVTKYLGGHSDVIGGALVVKDDQIAEQLYFYQNSAGAIPGPMDCFLVLRGLKTLHVRMEKHSSNGEAVAHFLANHPKVDKVYWPGFTHHKNHEVAKKQMNHFGGMISFTFKGDDLEKTLKVISNMKVFTLAESLGGVESLVGHPASMTHASIPKEERLKVGVTDSLIRLSIGIEDFADLEADLVQAFEHY